MSASPTLIQYDNDGYHSEEEETQSSALSVDIEETVENASLTYIYYANISDNNSSYMILTQALSIVPALLSRYYLNYQQGMSEVLLPAPGTLSQTPSVMSSNNSLSADNLNSLNLSDMNSIPSSVSLNLPSSPSMNGGQSGIQPDEVYCFRSMDKSLRYIL